MTKVSAGAALSGGVKYLLGIDGGGTKTEFLLTDIAHNEINRVILGASNPVNTGIENTKQILTQGISLACKGIDLNQISVFAGLAGGISGDNKKVIADFLSLFGFYSFANGSDTDNAVQITLGDDDGVSVIIGTGIVAFAVADGIRYRIGGWGYLIDKGGSGFAIGSDALNAALRYHDGRGGSKLMLDLIEKQTGKPLQDCIGDIYSGGTTYVASFAPVVFEAFEKSDRCAENIICKNAQEIADIIRTGCSFIKDNKKIVLCGGLCKKSDILKPFILKHLGDGYNLEFTTEPMVNGSVSLAEKELKKC